MCGFIFVDLYIEFIRFSIDLKLRFYIVDLNIGKVKL